MRVLLFTNARLITVHLADLFAQAPPRAPIEVTVYGMHEQSYERVTRAVGSFRQFRRGVNLLLEREIPFIVKSTLLPPNRRETDEFEAWARTIPWMRGRPRYAMFLDLRCRRDDAKKNEAIENVRLTPQDGLAVYLRDEATYRKWTRAEASRLLRSHGECLFNCGVCDGHDVCVDAYGRVQPCMGARAPELTVDLMRRPGAQTPHGSPGNGEGLSISSPRDGSTVTDGALGTALDSFSHLRTLRAENPEYLGRCAVCRIAALCEQCPAKSWAENGTLDTPVQYCCDVAHVVARHLGLLAEKERAWEVSDWESRIARTFDVEPTGCGPLSVSTQKGS
jgi:sulfatase maturation enzyme AslB (radical SAM superfamily)